MFAKCVNASACTAGDLRKARYGMLALPVLPLVLPPVLLAEPPSCCCPFVEDNVDACAEEGEAAGGAPPWLLLGLEPPLLLPLSL